MNWQWVLTTFIAVAGLSLSIYTVVRNMLKEKMNIVVNNGQVTKSWEYRTGGDTYRAEVYFDVINRSRSPITINSIALMREWVVYKRIWIEPLDFKSSPELPIKLTEHEGYRLHVEMGADDHIPDSSELEIMQKMPSILKILVDTSRGRFVLCGGLLISAITRLGKVEELSRIPSAKILGGKCRSPTL